MPDRYHIAFDTRDMPGKIKAVFVEIGEEINDPDSARIYNVALCDHPKYRLLEAYIKENPSKS